MGLVVKLEKKAGVDEKGNPILSTELKDEKGNIIREGGQISYTRHDNRVLAEITGLISNKYIATTEFVTMLTLSDKIQEAFKKDASELELSLEESTVLKKVINKVSEDSENVKFGLFHIGTLCSVLEQLK